MSKYHDDDDVPPNPEDVTELDVQRAVEVMETVDADDDIKKSCDISIAETDRSDDVEKFVVLKIPETPSNVQGEHRFIGLVEEYERSSEGLLHFQEMTKHSANSATSAVKTTMKIWANAAEKNCRRDDESDDSDPKIKEKYTLKPGQSTVADKGRVFEIEGDSDCGGGETDMDCDSFNRQSVANNVNTGSLSEEEVHSEDERALDVMEPVKTLSVEPCDLEMRCEAIAKEKEALHLRARELESEIDRIRSSLEQTSSGSTGS